MSNTAELIQEVYIDPIKSVLFIDDKFPTYAETIQAPRLEQAVLDGSSLKIKDDAQYQNPFESEPKVEVAVSAEAAMPDVERVLQLTKSCRTCGYIFDVENSAEAALAAESGESFINKADFVVLDFILDAKADSGKDALNIIDHLNSTKRFNMVVVYTNNDPSEVAQEIAFFLRGKNEHATLSKGAHRRLGDIPDECISESLIQYLSGGLAPLETWYAGLGFAGKPREIDIANAFEVYARDRFPNTPPQSDSCLHDCGITSDGIPWICGKGVFIAVVHKEKDNRTIESLLEILKSCLTAYVPSPISMLIHKSINTLKEGGPEILEKAFGDKETRAALLYHALTAECQASDLERVDELRFGDLMRKALSMLSFEVQRRTIAFGRRLLSHCAESCSAGDHFHTSTELEKCNLDSPRQLFLNLNAFLCCQPLETAHMTTGMIFRLVDDPTSIWICVTPACDLVPGRTRKGHGYRDMLSPANYFEALRIKHDKKLDDVLAIATQANHLFIEVDGTIQAYRILQGNSQQPHAYVFYTQDGGYLDENKILILKMICFETQNENTSLMIKEKKVEVIGQLRQEYASRFLAINGNWNSRIGVDFVDFRGNAEAAS